MTLNLISLVICEFSANIAYFSVISKLYVDFLPKLDLSLSFSEMDDYVRDMAWDDVFFIFRLPLFLSVTGYSIRLGDNGIG